MKTTTLVLVTCFGITNLGYSDVVLPAHLTTNKVSLLGNPVPPRFNPSTVNNQYPSIQGFTLSGQPQFVVQPWGSPYSASKNDPGGSYNPNGNYTYVGYTTNSVGNLSFHWYVNETGWSIGVVKSTNGQARMRIQGPMEVPIGIDEIWQNAPIYQNETIPDFADIITGGTLTLPPATSLWNYPEEVVDWNYRFANVNIASYTPPSLANLGGSTVTASMLLSASELSKDLIFEDGKWRPEQ